MANFLEFLKSGKTAKEFIDSAILPQHALPVEHTGLSPEPYEDEELDAGGDTDAVIDTATDSFKENSEAAAFGMMRQEVSEITESLSKTNGDYGDDEDPDFIAMLEAAEREGLNEEDE